MRKEKKKRTRTESERFALKVCVVHFIILELVSYWLFFLYFNLIGKDRGREENDDGEQSVGRRREEECR